MEACSRDEIAAAAAVDVVALVVAEEDEEEEVPAPGCGDLVQVTRSKASHMKSVHRCSSRFDISTPIHWQKAMQGLAPSCTVDCSWSCTPVF